MANREYIEGVDYYLEDGFVVLTAHFHKQRGFCCGKDCRHCPYVANIKGITELKPEENKDE